MSANWVQDQKFVAVTRPASVAAGAVSTTQVDTLGYDVIEYWIYMGTASGLDMSVCQVTHSDSDGSNHSNVSGASIADQTTASAKTFMVRVHKGGAGKRYFDLTLTTGSATAVLAVFALLKKAREHPPSSTGADAETTATAS